MAKIEVELSRQPKTWIIDIDGTVFRHNGYLTTEGDVILPGVKDFFLTKVQKDDYILFITARDEKYRKKTIEALRYNNIHFDGIIFSAPKGERVVINDTKPKGMVTAHAIPVERDSGLIDVSIDFQERI